MLAEKTTPDNVHKWEEKSNDIVAQETVVETKLDGDDEEDNDATTSNEEHLNQFPCAMGLH